MLVFNIEDDTIRLTSSRGRKITFAMEIPLVAGWVQNGVIVDRLAVGQQIIKTLVENRINEREAVACVSAVHSIYRVVFVPKLERRLLAEAAKKEMERVSPVPLETLYTSWQEIKTSDVEAALCLLGLPHDNVDSIVDTMTLAGLKLKWLELKPLAVSRVIDEPLAIVVNIQPNSFDMTIVDNGIPDLVRSLTFPQAAMPDSEKVAVVREELARTVNFHNSSHTERQLGSSTVCFFSGQQLAGLAQDVGYIVKPLPDLVAYPAGVDAGRFAANTGMLMKEAGGKSRLMQLYIDVMPRAVAPVKVAAAGPGSAPLVALILGALVIIALFIVGNSAGRATAELQSETNALTKLVADTQTASTQQNTQASSLRDQYTQTLNNLKAPLDYLVKQRSYSNRDLGTVTSLLPGIMYLTSFHDDGESLLLEGLSPSSDMVLKYARDLKQSNNFRDVAVTTIDNQNYSEFKFGLKLTLNR
jgi:Tfp pilus assembly protein PilN